MPGSFGEGAELDCKYQPRRSRRKQGTGVTPLQRVRDKAFFIGVAIMVLSPLANFFIPTWAVLALIYSGFLCSAISFFADYEHQPEEGFVYLKNEGNYNFTPFSIPNTQLGRWLTMDAGDINGDGKIDLVLGNFTIGPSVLKSKIDLVHTPPFIILKNTGK